LADKKQGLLKNSPIHPKSCCGKSVYFRGLTGANPNAYWVVKSLCLTYKQQELFFPHPGLQGWKFHGFQVSFSFNKMSYLDSKTYGTK